MAVAGSLRVGFSRVGADAGGGSVITTLALAADPGPESIKVDWGNADPYGLAAQSETYLPGLDGSVPMPGPATDRGYLDGDYLIKLKASSPGGVIEKTADGMVTDSVVLTAFIDAHGTVGLAKTGDTRDNLMVGGSGHDSFSGTRGDDWLLGGAGNDSLAGGEDQDVLQGGGGNDTADGGTGNDKIAGGDGADSLLGDAGADSIDGGAGNDRVDGGTGDDAILGDGGAIGHDTLLGGSGNDSVYGEAGDDSLNGGSGNDSLIGGAGKDSLAGGADDDRLFGNDGNDKLNAGAGSDTVTGGLGRDVITASADGALDLFVFDALAEGGDRITGFELGIDRIALTFLAPLDSAHIVGSAGAMTDTGAHVIYNAASGALSVDLDGTEAGAAVLMATLVGAPGLTHGDFLFGPLA